MNIFGMAINNTAFIIIWVFFVKTVGVINGWTAADIIGLLGFATICFGLVLSVGDGFRRLPDMVSSGSFDRFLLNVMLSAISGVLLYYTEVAFYKKFQEHLIEKQSRDSPQPLKEIDTSNAAYKEPIVLNN